MNVWSPKFYLIKIRSGKQKSVISIIAPHNYNSWWLANWSLSIFSLNTGLIFIGAAAAASDQTRDGWRTQCGLPGAGLINSLVSSCPCNNGIIVKVKERHYLQKSGEAREAQTS